VADNPRIELALNPNGVAEPAQRAAAVCREVVDLYFAALVDADLGKAPVAHGTNVFLRFAGCALNLTSDQRREIHEAWILAKVFQDLVRGVRASLEEAYFFIRVLDEGKMTVRSSSTLDEILAPFRKAANDLTFPALLAKVNARLEKPLVSDS
jgi:hypothetical protein